MYNLVLTGFVITTLSICLILIYSLCNDYKVWKMNLVKEKIKTSGDQLKTYAATNKNPNSLEK